MCGPQAIPVVLAIGGAYLQNQSAKKAQERAFARQQQQQRNNMLATHNRDLQQAENNRNAQQTNLAFQLQGIDAQKQGNQEINQQTQQAAQGFDAQEALARIESGTNEQVARANEALAESEALGARVTQSGVEGNVSDALLEKSAVNKAGLNEDASRLAKLFGGIQAIRGNSLDEAINLADAGTQIGITHQGAQSKANAAKTQGAIAGQPLNAGIPILDTSNIVENGSSDLGSLLSLAGSGYNAYQNGAFGSGFKQ